jgi:hypothetical protein
MLKVPLHVGGHQAAAFHLASARAQSPRSSARIRPTVATAGLAAPAGRQDRQVSPPAATENDLDPVVVSSGLTVSGVPHTAHSSRAGA